jgi:DNA-directed RNA polymerase
MPPAGSRRCDAAHLLRTVNEGITSIGTVYDSFGCLPSQAERFRRIIREQFAQMYKDHDVLDEVFKQAQKDIGDPDNKRMREAQKARPQYGDLDINEVKNAEYAFA